MKQGDSHSPIEWEEPRPEYSETQEFRNWEKKHEIPPK